MKRNAGVMGTPDRRDIRLIMALEKELGASPDRETARRILAAIDGVPAADERQQFEAAMGEALKTDQGAYALSRAYLPDQPYTFLATKWAWSAWQRARGVAPSDELGFQRRNAATGIGLWLRMVKCDSPEDTEVLKSFLRDVQKLLTAHGVMGAQGDKA